MERSGLGTLLRQRWHTVIMVVICLIFASISSSTGWPYGSNSTYTRSITGVGNNLENPSWGAATTEYSRSIFPAAYDDGCNQLARSNGTSARIISNLLFSRPNVNNPRLVNDLQTGWAQIVVADINDVFRGEMIPFEPLTYMHIPVPEGDLYLDPYAEGDKTCNVIRSAYSPFFPGAPSPCSPENPVRQQVHRPTAFIDCSWLYSYDDTAGQPPLAPLLTANSTRTFVDGKLNNSYWYTLPAYILQPIPGNPVPWKWRGDERTNKTPLLIGLSDLFGLEHNRLCDEFKAANGNWTDEQLFQEARKWVIAFFQKITIREWLASSLGEPLLPYTGYNASVEPAIENFFSSVAMRYGHSEVQSLVQLLDDNYQVITHGNGLLRDLYWNPKYVLDNFGAEPIFRGAFVAPQAEIDEGFIDDVRNFMFGPPGWTQTFQPLGICGDLPATNIMRGRDHGLPDYNTCRVIANLSRIEQWSDLTNDTDIITILEELYPDGVDTLDPYVGGILEAKWFTANVGPLFHFIIKEQFRRLRDGDRFWFENPDMFTPDELSLIYQTTLMDIMRRNYNITIEATEPGQTFWLQSRTLAGYGADKADIPYPEIGTYQNFIDLSATYRLSWTYNHKTDKISLMIQSKSSGWVGVGFYNNNGTMKGADIMFCHRLDDGTYELRDSFALDVGKPALDTDIGGHNDLTGVSGTFVNGIVTCKFTRPRASGDHVADKVIKEGLVPVIFAFHPTSNDFVYHGPTRSAAFSLNILGSGCPTGTSIADDGIHCLPDTGTDSGTIVGAVIGSVGGVLLLCLLLFALIMFYQSRTRKPLKEEQILLAEEWTDDESEQDSLDAEESVTTASTISKGSRHMSITDLEQVNVTFEPKVLRFGLDINSKCPVDTEVTDHFEIVNNGPARKFTFFVPAETEKFKCTLHPGTGVLKSGKPMRIQVNVTLLMTTNVDRKIRFDVEGLGSYIIQINLTGELSTKLDPDDIVIDGAPLGQGSFGTVYKATYRGQEVAAKVLLSQMDRRQVQEFHKEVDIVTRLRSPYVLSFIGASFVPGKICLVSELCPKGSLNSLVFSEKPFNYLVLLKVALDAARGINFLHSNGVMHRDVKPDNFLLFSNSSKAQVTCKVADFGTSRSVTQALEPFNHTAALGTPIYMAPEILDHQQYSIKVDVYSFGVMLWVMYTRREPYGEFKRQWDIPRHVLKGGRPTIPDHCPIAFTQLITECWAQSEKDRPTMKDVVAKLESMFEEEKALNRDDEDNEKRRGKKKAVKQTARSATGMGADDGNMVKAKHVHSTWEGGVTGLMGHDSDNEDDDMRRDSSSDSSDNEIEMKKLKGKGKEH